MYAAAAAKSLQSCLTPRPYRWKPTRLPRPWDSPGKNTGVGCHFLLQCVKVKLLRHIRLLVTPWTAAHQAPPSTGFSRQEYWSGVPLPSSQMYATFIVIKNHKMDYCVIFNTASNIWLATMNDEIQLPFIFKEKN